MKKVLSVVLFLLMHFSGFAQVVSGPMLGDVGLRTAKIWIETLPESEVTLKVKKADVEMGFNKIQKRKFNFQYTVFELYGLKPGTEYTYEIIIQNPGNPIETKVGKINTQELWQFRKPAPDVTILTGSCAFINEKRFDRPGNKYGTGPEIFETMASEDADAFLWLGDNWYYREVDYFSEYGLYYRPHHDRAIPQLQNLLSKFPHYAQWDDHDYGPNNSNSSYIYKDLAREVFKTYWLNPTYGQNDEAIYTMFSISDVDFFILDTRWYRAADHMHDDDKPFLGRKQMTWLQNALMASNATFKIICTGSQVLNENSRFEKYQNFRAEYEEFMNFIQRESISGILFLSGDRHHSSVVRRILPDFYTLYDITVSPFTSGTYPFSGKEKNPADRILGIDMKHNYGKISVTGKRKHRTLNIDFISTEGNLIDAWKIHEDSLKVQK